MQIYGAGPIHGAHAINPTHMQRTRNVSEVAFTAAPQDQIDISPIGRMMEKVEQIPDIRSEKVSALRQAIAQGIYDTPDRLNLALDRMLDELV